MMAHLGAPNGAPKNGHLQDFFDPGTGNCSLGTNMRCSPRLNLRATMTPREVGHDRLHEMTAPVAAIVYGSRKRK